MALAWAGEAHTQLAAKAVTPQSKVSTVKALISAVHSKTCFSSSSKASPHLYTTTGGDTDSSKPSLLMFSAQTNVKFTSRQHEQPDLLKQEACNACIWLGL